MTRQIRTALVFATALAVFGGIPTPAGAVTLEAISNASTPADHEALAAEYEKEATEARQEAAKHRAMAEGYSGNVKYGKITGSGKASMRSHCERLASHYDEAAADAEALAKFHRQIASGK